MAHTAYTLHLDEHWDIRLTESGNIAVAEGDHATAQNVANECRLFTSDAYFDQERGIPWFTAQLGRKPAESVVRAHLRRAALLVDGVAGVDSVTLEGHDPASRTLNGEIRFTLQNGESGVVDI